MNCSPYPACLTGLDQVNHRVATISFTLAGYTPQQVARHLGQKDIYVWNGNFYALAITTRLGLEEQGGLVRVGATHYNTLDEIATLGSALRELVKA
jgi:selenocysteine lyase/cysteine desulfurase